MAMSLADRITALFLAVLGLSMAVGGYTMDRLEIRNIHPGSIPGLVPMILGALMVICAALLWRSAAQAGSSEDAPDTGLTFADGSWPRLGLTAALCLIYALVLVGWLPFLWATALFVFGFAVIFGWPTPDSPRNPLRVVAVAAVLSLIMSWGTSYMFSELFLVRLP